MNIRGLLSALASWTIVGRSEAARTYAGREAFMRDVIRPFNARMRLRGVLKKYGR